MDPGGSEPVVKAAEPAAAVVKVSEPAAVAKAPEPAPKAAQPPPAEPQERLPQVNEVIVGEKTRRRYRLLSVLGRGGYGTVFEAVDEAKSIKVAIKAEKASKSMLRVEANVLKTASQQRCTRIVEYIEYGHVRPDFCYLVMPLLGRDLHFLRNERKETRFSLSTVVRVGIMALQAIQELHQKCGYLSRDIKPSNFAIGTGEHDRRIFLIDFGLARKYLDKNGNVIPSRKEVGWRGTTRYGSLQAHLKQDLGRKDDVESWFYMLVELTTGTLPWRSIVDRNTVQAAKVSARTHTRIIFLCNCPREYDLILSYVDGLTFSDAPNYEKITGLLEDIMKQIDTNWETLYDWEDETTKSEAMSISENDSQKADHVRLSREKVTTAVHR